MNTVEERILIPAPPELIWDFVSNIDNIPAWQANCRGISYLTSNKYGRGVRWRKIAMTGRDQVWEATAWYDGIGFEYRIVDGVSYKANMGRIRIQDTPDGVIVQWTFSYDPGGPLGGLRSMLSLRRSVENEVVDGLWALWREITAIAKDIQGDYIAKSLMREAPDAESRANYKPRHPSSILHDQDKDTEPHRPEFPHHSALMDEEPPIVQDDTRPRPVVEVPEAETVDNVREPDFLSEIPDTDPGTVRATQDLQTYIDETADLETVPEELLFHSPMEVTRIERVEEPVQSEGPPKAPEKTIEDAVPRNIPPVQEPEPRSTTPSRDTAEVSVFDLFGVRRPTEEISEQPAVVPEPERVRERDLATQSPQPTIVIREDSIGVYRVGLRLKMRRRLINIRPTK